MATSSPPKSNSFPITKWTLVRQARGEATSDAWTDIFKSYWYPLYAYVRRRGYNMHDAEDLTQGFFYELISKDCLASADRERGRLRAFLLAMLKNHLASEWKRSQAAKRGGGQQIVSLNVAMAEEKIDASDSSKELSPEDDFDRKWAITLFQDALAELQRDIEERHGKKMFTELRHYLIHQADRVDYKKLQEAVGIVDSNMRIMVHRQRKALRRSLRARVAETLMDEADVEDEFRYVMMLLSR